MMIIVMCVIEKSASDVFDVSDVTDEFNVTTDLDLIGLFFFQCAMKQMNKLILHSFFNLFRMKSKFMSRLDGQSWVDKQI